MSAETLVYVEVGRTVEANGSIITAKPAEELSQTEPGETSAHESPHAVVAEETGSYTSEGSRKPDGDSLGHVTITGGFNRFAFAAAAADGCDGAGYDLWAIRKMGYDVGSSILGAQVVLNANRDLVSALHP